MHTNYRDIFNVKYPKWPLGVKSIVCLPLWCNPLSSIPLGKMSAVELLLLVEKQKACLRKVWILSNPLVFPPLFVSEAAPSGSNLQVFESRWRLRKPKNANDSFRPRAPQWRRRLRLLYRKWWWWRFQTQGLSPVFSFLSVKMKHIWYKLLTST